MESQNFKLDDLEAGILKWLFDIEKEKLNPGPFASNSAEVIVYVTFVTSFDSGLEKMELRKRFNEELASNQLEGETDDLAEKKIALKKLQETEYYYEIKLAWSEYKDKRWLNSI